MGRSVCISCRTNVRSEGSLACEYRRLSIACGYPEEQDLQLVDVIRDLHVALSDLGYGRHHCDLLSRFVFRFCPVA